MSPSPPHATHALALGDVRFLDAGAGAPAAIAFERTLGEQRLVVACSFDDEACALADLGCAGAEVLLGNYADAPSDGTLRPYEAVVWDA